MEIRLLYNVCYSSSTILVLWYLSMSQYVVRMIFVYFRLDERNDAHIISIQIRLQSTSRRIMF